MKKISLLILCLLLLVGCSPTRESEIEKLGEYWHSLLYDYKSELRAEYDGETISNVDINKTILVKLISGEPSDVFEAHYFEIDHEFAYEEIDLNTMTYKKVMNYWFDEDNGQKSYTLTNYKYNYLNNTAEGSYAERIFNSEGEEIESKAYGETYLYNFNSGISECSKTVGYNYTSECNFSSTIAKTELMRMQEEFIKKIRLSGVDETLLK